jgi:hypothetical protein
MDFGKPPEPFPQTPGANGDFFAPSGMGKTIAMLLGPCDNVFNQVHVFSPGADIDAAWLPAELAASMKGSNFHSEWDEEALKQILDDQPDTIKELQAAKTTKVLPQALTTARDKVRPHARLHAPEEAVHRESRLHRSNQVRRPTNNVQMGRHPGRRA